MIQAGLLMVKATLIVSAALIAWRLMRRRRATERHAVMAAVFGVLLMLPIVSVLGPSRNFEMPIAAPPTSALTRVLVVATAVGPTFRDVDSAPFSEASTLAPAALSTALVALVAWAAGALLCLLPMLAGAWRIRSLRRCGRPWPIGARLVRHVAAEAGIRRPMEVLLHERIASPVTYGALRPVVVLPLDAETWTKDELERAIVHELEHVRRADWLTQCLARMICAAYWFHPLVWMAWRRLVLDAERACDDAVLRQAEPTAYADQLVVMAARGSSGARRPMLAMAGRDDLGVRVRSILDSAQERGRPGAACLVLTASTAIAAVAAVAPLQAVAVQPAAPVAVLVSAVPVDPEVTNELAVTRPMVRLPPSPLTRLRRPGKPDATLSAQVRLKPDPTFAPIVDRSSDDSRAFVTDAQVAQTDAAPAGRQMWILLFDVTASQTLEMRAVVEVARRWAVQDMSNADMVAVVTVGTKITVVSDFISSREELVTLLQSPGLLSEGPAGVGTLTGPRITDIPPDPFNDLRLRGLTVVCNMVAPIKDRKRLLYFTTGLRSGNADNVAELSATTDACNRANVLIFPVDARGLVSIPNPNPNAQSGPLFR